MKSLFQTTAMTILLAATIFSCSKEKVMLEPKSNQFTPVDYNESSSNPDTPYVTGVLLDTPYIGGKIIDTPYVNGIISDTPYIGGKILDTPYVGGKIIDTPYIKK